MCFSAQMSFIVSASLVGIAALTYSKVREKEQIPLATIPLLFAIQQFAEGILWVVLPQSSSPLIVALAQYTFLSIAFIVWPIFIPFALLLLEEQFIRRLIIASCLVLGIAWSFVTAWYLLTYGATVQIDGGHLYYQVIGIITENYTRQALYFTATILPFFASDNRAIQALGGLTALAVLVSYLFWYTYFISVWCFFAAVISLSIYYIMRYQLD